MAKERDGLAAAGIMEALEDLATIPVEVLDECPSTNQALKQRADSLPAWYTLIAGRQTAGRGRLGRSFYSPDGTGLYMSVLLRPALALEDAWLITTAAAVAVCRAVEQLGSDQARIKWVNDVYIQGRKVCGILTEAGLDKAGGMRYAVLGIGVNVSPPADGFPPELAAIAGAVFPESRQNLRNRLAAAILRQFYVIYTALPQRGFIAEYQARSFLPGRRVNVLRGCEARRALVLAVDDRCRLAVRYEDGTEELLFSGDVSIRQEEGQP